MFNFKIKLFQSDRWLRLTQRERIFISVGGIIATIVLTYALLWSPLHQRVSALKSEVVQQKDLLLWMQHATPLLGTHITAKTIQPENMLPLLDESLSQQQLKTYVTQFQQATNNGVDLQFKSVPFDDLVKWLTWLWQNYTIKVTRLALTPTSTAGLVDVTLNVQISPQ